MAKAIVNICDMCGQWDSQDVAVSVVGVAGVKFALCPTDRVKLLVGLNVVQDKAEKFVALFDIRKDNPNVRVTLAGVERLWTQIKGGEEAPEPASEENRPAPVPEVEPGGSQVDHETIPEPVDLPGELEEGDTGQKPTRTRRTAK